MSYKIFIRTLLKNINEKDIGCINFEISFTHKTNKKKIRRYVNTSQYINKNDFGKSGIKANREDLKTLKFLIEKKKQETAEFLRNLEIKNGKISPEIYDDAIKASEDSKKNIFELFEIFLEYKKRTKTFRTYQKFASIKTALTKFAESKNLKNIYPSDISKNFLTDFTVYLTEKRGLSNETLNKYQSGFNTFMDYITKDLGITDNLAYRDFEKVSRNRESDTKVVLLKEHIRKINKYKPKNKRFELVKDLFLFQIFTGIRYSDLVRVKKSFVQNNQLSFVMYKTRTMVSIPLHTKAKAILIKYDYNLGEQAKSLKNYNLDLKALCRSAGLTEEVSTLKLKLTEAIPDDTPLCDLVSSHVGRTTFITNCLVSGISPFIVKSYSGHKKIETLAYYMKLAGNISQDAFQKFQDYLNFR
jgi:site-specific recombinase XerD